MKILSIIKKEPMLLVSVLAALISLLITPPEPSLLTRIDWHTLGMLFMMLCVLEGFKKENILRPVVNLCARLKRLLFLTLFLVFGVFFTSMFVTNDVSLIIFVPLTILLFRSGGREELILPVITMENIAAIRGSLLLPFGSPQNLFLYGHSTMSVVEFIVLMLPLCAMSAALLIVFILVLYRRDMKTEIRIDTEAAAGKWEREGRVRRIVYGVLFALLLFIIISRTEYWYIGLVIVPVVIFALDRSILLKVDYVLLLTFLCFFVFSSSIAANEHIAAFLHGIVSGHEYVSVILLSQIISNVPASIVLFPFSNNFAALIYGADTAGLCSIIGSLASVINYRIYVREYPGCGGKFLKTFTWISLLFFCVVAVPGYLLSK